MNHKVSTLLCRRVPKWLCASSVRCIAQDSSKPPTTGFTPRQALVAGGLGLAGGLLAYSSFWPQGIRNLQTAPDSEPISPILPLAPPYNDKRKKIRYPEDKSALKITLYQVRAFLDYYGVSYDIVEVNSVFKKEIKWSNDYKKVPILVVKTPQGEHLQLNDSTMIISALMTYLKEPSKDLKKILECYPQVMSTNEETGKSFVEVRNKYFIMSSESGPADKGVKDELKWRKWVDGVFVHRISPNVYRSFSESLEAFHWFDMAGEWKAVFNTFERQVVIYSGATVMWILGKVLKKRHNIQDDVREAIYVEINRYLDYVKKSGGKFGGGAEPNLADISFYGTLNSFEGCGAFQDILANTKLKEWFKNMKWAVGSRGGASRI